jgi:hypothetical protein
MRRCLVVTLLLGSLVLRLDAQNRTWVVDVNNGPGTDFTALQTAFDAASEGDTLIVRSGRYAPCVATKGLTVLGQGGVVIGPGNPLWSILEIRDLAAGRVFVLKRVRVEHAGNPCGLRLASNAGRVHVEAVDTECIQRGLFVPSWNLGLDVDHCATVTVANSTIRGAGVNCSYSHLVITESAINGLDGERGCATPVLCGLSTPALRGTDSSVTLASCALQGGEGNNGPPVRPSANAVELQRSRLMVTGPSLVRAGQFWHPTYLATFAVIAWGSPGSSVRHSPAASFVGGQNGGSFAGVVPQVSVHQPALLVQGTRYGGRIQFTWLASPQDWFAVAVSAPASPVLVAAGDLLIDPHLAALFWIGRLGPSGVATQDLPLPSSGPPGIAVAFQGVNGAANGSDLWLSNAVVAVID